MRKKKEILFFMSPFCETPIRDQRSHAVHLVKKNQLLYVDYYR